MCLPCKSRNQAPPMAAAKDDPRSEIYHERQRLQYCLLHSLNNLFQQKDAFTRAILNEVSDSLAREDTESQRWSPISLIFKPHHNLVSGNYDVNVLIAALQRRGKSVKWHDRREKASSIDLESEGLMGIVLNIPTKKYGGILTGRHWVAVRKIDGVWYNLDSELDAPEAFQGTEWVAYFLDSAIGLGAQVLLVLSSRE